MQKKLLKLLSFAMAAMIAVSVILPSSANAAGTTAAEITAQIKRTYSQCRKSFGRSFDGYCGTLTGYQLYYMGITTGRDRQNGKDGYDNYCSKTYSTGGYRIKAYSGKSWTLKEALNKITENGTKDAFNILVGFESTPSRAGRRYGHSCVIHGIIDGRVYFMESYGAYVNGKRYREGEPISCTIEEFCEYYRTTTTKFDGVIHFGAKDYADGCDRYPTSFEGVVLEQAELRSQPCLAREDSSSKLLGTLNPGDPVDVVGIIENNQGCFWYQITGATPGYVYAEQIQVSSFHYEDVTLKNISAPSALRQGRSYKIKGEIETKHNQLYTVRSQVFSLNGNTQEQVLSTVDMVEDTHYSLQNSAISQELAFRELLPGSYRYELAAVVGSYYFSLGQLQVQWETVPLWNSDFHVTEKKSDACQITFDECGGTVSVNRAAVVDGEPIGQLPTAQRGTEVFLGWYTDKEGGERITAEYLPEDDMTLYAHYSTPEELEAAADAFWYIYADGTTVIGCAEIDGVLYHFTAPDLIGLGGTLWTTGY